MKKDPILILLFVVSIMLGIVGGMFWRSEEVHRLRGVLELKNNTLIQTEAYLNQINLDDIARGNLRLLGYNIKSKNDN